MVTPARAQQRGGSSRLEVSAEFLAVASRDRSAETLRALYLHARIGAMFAYTPVDIFAQLSALPLIFKLWLLWLGGVCIVLPLFLLRHRLARVIVAYQVGNLVFISWIALSLGLVRLTSLAHIVFWTPMLIHVYCQLPTVPRRSPFGIFLRLFLATAAVSLVFDYADVCRYFLGDRGIVGQE